MSLEEKDRFELIKLLSHHFKDYGEIQKIMQVIDDAVKRGKAQ